MKYQIFYTMTFRAVGTGETEERIVFGNMFVDASCNKEWDIIRRNSAMIFDESPYDNFISMYL